MNLKFLKLSILIPLSCYASQGFNSWMPWNWGPVKWGIATIGSGVMCYKSCKKIPVAKRHDQAVTNFCNKFWQNKADRIDNKTRQEAIDALQFAGAGQENIADFNDKVAKYHDFSSLEKNIKESQTKETRESKQALFDHFHQTFGSTTAVGRKYDLEIHTLETIQKKKTCAWATATVVGALGFATSINSK